MARFFSIFTLLYLSLTFFRPEFPFNAMHCKKHDFHLVFIHVSGSKYGILQH